MNLNEFLEANNVKREIDLFNGDKYHNLELVIGKNVWICDYRLNDNRDSKPIRNIFPKEVMVVSNDELPRNKNVYYSPIHFREVKNGKVLKTVIAPYDNTGYRFRTGTSLNIFDTKTECVNHFISQCNVAITEYNGELERRTTEIESRKDEIRNLIVKASKIILEKQ